MVSPAVVVNAPVGIKVSCQEVFGPVVVIYPFETMDEAIDMVNEVPTFRVDQMPYGGVKDSGMGREGLKYAIEEMTEMKLISLQPL
jgi:acyl-CoA reductase-like NAD-dependent aldehyde dehydrogenase